MIDLKPGDLIYIKPDLSNFSRPFHNKVAIINEVDITTSGAIRYWMDVNGLDTKEPSNSKHRGYYLLNDQFPGVVKLGNNLNRIDRLL